MNQLHPAGGDREAGMSWGRRRERKKRRRKGDKETWDREIERKKSRET